MRKLIIDIRENRDGFNLELSKEFKEAEIEDAIFSQFDSMEIVRFVVGLTNGLNKKEREFAIKRVIDNHDALVEMESKGVNNE